MLKIKNNIFDIIRSAQIRLDKYFLFVLLTTSIVLISHTFYVMQTAAYPEWDEHRYLAAAVHFLPALHHPDIHFFQKMLSLQKQWLPATPPLYPLLLDVPLLFFGTAFTYKISIWLNVIFYIATIWGVYLLGKEFFSKKVSAITTFIFAFYGFPLFYLNFVYTEPAGTAFTVLALYFLAKSNNFQILRNVLLFSIFFALAVLTRWTTPLFIIGSFIVVITIVIKQGLGFNKKIILRNILIFLACCLVPLIVYYIPNHDAFMFYLKSATADSASWVPAYLRNPFSLHSLIWYLSTFAQLTILFYILFLTGFFLSIFYFKKFAFLVCAFVIPFIFFTFFSIFKDDRFVVPIYPTIALLSGVVFDFIEKRKWGRIFNILLLVTVIMSILNFLGTSWGIGPMKFSTTGNWENLTLPNSILMPMPIGHARRVWLTPVSWPPRADEGKVDLLINEIVKDWNKKTPPHVLSTFEMSQVSTALYSKVAYERLGVIDLNDLAGIKSGDYVTFFKDIKNADYIIVKDGIIDKGIKSGKSGEWDAFIPFVRLFNTKKNQVVLPNAYVPIKYISIPFDKSILIIYKKQREVLPDEWEKFGSAFQKIDTQNSAAIDTALQSIIH